MPKFKLTRDEQQTQLCEFLLYVETVRFETTADGVREFPRLAARWAQRAEMHKRAQAAVMLHVTLREKVMTDVNARLQRHRDGETAT